MINSTITLALGANCFLCLLIAILTQAETFKINYLTGNIGAYPIYQSISNGVQD